MYLLSATGRSSFPKTSWLEGDCKVLSMMKSYVATTSSLVTGMPSENRALGLMRKRNVILSAEICQCVARDGMYSSVVGWSPTRLS